LIFIKDENHAILISSHIISDLEKLCDYIAFLHKGKLLVCEEKDRMLEKYGILNAERKTLQTSVRKRSRDTGPANTEPRFWCQEKRFPQASRLTALPSKIYSYIP
jgi:ABC-type multidrug transport system ATPase subunit